MTHILPTTGADVMGMKPTAKPTAFNPSLGLAIKGMWSTNFTKALVTAIDHDDDPEPASEPQAA